MPQLSKVIFDRLLSVAPIVGVSIGREDDRAKWRIDFKPEATAAQRATALAMIAAFDVDVQAANVVMLTEISTLEAAQTPRRLREAILAVDGGWLAQLNQRIALIRARLR